MLSNSIIENVRNIVCEIMLSIFAPVALLLSINNVTNGVFDITDYELKSYVLFGGLFAFVFPSMRAMVYTGCILTNAVMLMLRIQMKCKTEWDCRSAYDLLAKYFPH